MTNLGPAPRINAIATAIPDSDVDAAYSGWAARNVSDPRKLAILERMQARSGIEHRYSVLSSDDGQLGHGSFYNNGASPGTAARMRLYAEHAPELALKAAQGLPELAGITHLVVASCTGFVAPGLDQIIARELGLAADVERIFVGFMGCYAGVTALRTAAHLVRSRPEARVLTIAVELCTLHMQETDELEALLAMGQFADGAAAALVTGSGDGLEIGGGLSVAMEESDDLITWQIGDTGFTMHLSGAVPGRLAEALSEQELVTRITGGRDIAALDAWAVHPGGRSVLDAVGRGLGLSENALAASRSVLRENGNMSSASVLFVLQQLMGQKPKTGVAMAFGPGLALEGFHFGWIGSDA